MKEKLKSLFLNKKNSSPQPLSKADERIMQYPNRPPKMKKYTFEKFGISFDIDDADCDIIFQNGKLKITNPSVNPLKAWQTDEYALTTQLIAIPNLLLATFNARTMSNTLICAICDEKTRNAHDYRRYTHSELLESFTTGNHLEILQRSGFNMETLKIRCADINEATYVISESLGVKDYNLRCETIKQETSIIATLYIRGIPEFYIPQVARFDKLVHSIKFITKQEQKETSPDNSLITKQKITTKGYEVKAFSFKFRIDEAYCDMIFRKGELIVSHPDINPLEAIAVSKEEFVSTFSTIPDLIFYTFNKQSISDIYIHSVIGENSTRINDYSIFGHDEIMGGYASGDYAKLLGDLGFDTNHLRVRCEDINGATYIISESPVIGNYHLRYITIKQGVEITLSLNIFGSSEHIAPQKKIFEDLIRSIKFIPPNE